MSFHSAIYLILFLPLVSATAFLLRRASIAAARWWITLVSFLYCASFGLGGVPVLLGSALGNFILARWIGSRSEKRARSRSLAVGVAANLLLLCAFKYSESWFQLLPGSLRGERHGLGLPLGLSFYTIAQIALLVDVAQGLVKPPAASTFFLFVSFFPKLTAGPIAPFAAFQKQLDAATALAPSYERLSRAAFLFALGMFQKVVLSDGIAPWVTKGFSGAAPLTPLEAWIAAAAHTLQLYFDFSGYSDMAVASAMVLGLDLPQNFDRPLLAKSVVEFWTRWHMSLTRFLTNYVNAPILRAAEKATFPVMLGAVMVTMTIAGVWHGAGWTFLLFGLAHGAAMVVNHVWKRRKRKLPAAFAHLFTVAFVVASLVLFRAPSLAAAGDILGAMIGTTVRQGHPLSLPTLGHDTSTVLAAAAAVLCTLFVPSSTELVKRFRPTVLRAVLAVGLVIFSLGKLSGQSSFVYANF